MALEIGFTVHNITTQPARAQVKHKGDLISATLDCVEVELVGDDTHGSLTLRFTGPDAEKARLAFKVGKTVTWKL